MANERGISLIDLGKIAETDGGKIDRILDERQKKIGEKRQDCIMEWRLAFYFIPHAIKIFLTVESREASRRIYHDNTRGKIDHHVSLEEAAKNIEIRRESENERYMKYYGIHIYDMSLYDIVIDTTQKTADEVFETILREISLLAARQREK